MAFQQTAYSLANSSIKDPQTTQLGRTLRFINRRYEQANERNGGSTQNITYNATDIIEGWIVRNPAGLSNDVTPTATQIYNAVLADLTKVSNVSPKPIQNGFYFDFAIYNEGAGNIVLTGGTNVTLGAAPSFTIAAGTTGWMRVTITNVGVTKEVYISLLG